MLQQDYIPKQKYFYILQFYLPHPMYTSRIYIIFDQFFHFLQFQYYLKFHHQSMNRIQNQYLQFHKQVHFLLIHPGLAILLFSLFYLNPTLKYMTILYHLFHSIFPKSKCVSFFSYAALRWVIHRWSWQVCKCPAQVFNLLLLKI